MSTRTVQFTGPVPPAKPQKVAEFESSLGRWSINFATGFAGLFASLMIVTSVKRILAHQWVNSGGTDFATTSEFYAAVEQHAGIGVIVLVLWSLGLLFSAYLSGRKFANSTAMILCLSAVCFCGWVVPHVWLNGGFAGMTSILRALLIVPLVSWGVLLGQEISYKRLRS